MYASLLMSLLAAFVAMLGKQWLNRYLRHAGGSIVERCRDRQLKYDGLQRWPFHLFVESLPVMLQMSLLLLACGLCRYTWSINTSVASVLITLTVLGILFYLGIVIAGMSSYECPFQTPASTHLRSLWKGIRSHKTLLTRPAIAIGPLWNTARPIVVATHHFKHTITGVILDFNQWARVRFGPRPQANYLPPVISLGEIREDPHPSPQPNPPPLLSSSSSHGINSPTTNDVVPLPHDSSSSQEISTNTMEIIEPWLTPENLTSIQKTNAKDARCVSWIFRNITDPEALDAAIRFAGTVLWFEDGINAEPPYSVIVSIFHTCFDSTGIMYPTLSERAYYSARAILWIVFRASCVSLEFAISFPPPHSMKATPGHQDLDSLLTLISPFPFLSWFPIMNDVIRCNSRAHMQWTFYAALHSFWTAQGREDFVRNARYCTIQDIPWNTIHLDVTLNFLLICSISLGRPLEDKALKIQDKTYAVPGFYWMLLILQSLVFAWHRSYLNYPVQLSQPFPPPPHSSGVYSPS